jgi:glutamate synthase domain-containing protein 2
VPPAVCRGRGAAGPQIKISQGTKPGLGGVLPGPKVSAETGLPVGIKSAVGDMRFWSSCPS